MQKGFRITEGRGFHITFANGYTISVQFGAGNYCDNKHAPMGMTVESYKSTQRLCGEMGSDTAEIGIFHEDHKDMIDVPGSYDVEGWASPERVAEVIGIVAGWERGEVVPRPRPVYADDE